MAEFDEIGMLLLITYRAFHDRVTFSKVLSRRFQLGRRIPFHG